MLSQNLEELTALFESLQPDDRKAFTAVVKAAAQAQGFNLKDLVTAKEEDDGIRCPRCHQVEVVKFGIRKDTQWYKCKACSKTFSSTTGTFLSWTKKSFYTWKLFFKSMMDGQPIRKAATVCKINRNTAFVWRHKVLDALTQHQNSQPRMKGIIEADDTYFQLSYKGSTPKDRESRERGSPASKRGISKEKVCVSCAVDRNGNVFSRVSGLGKPTSESLWDTFKGRLSKHSVVVTDKDTAYAKYAASVPFEHIQLKSGIERRGPYHVQNINAYHSRLKHFTRKFKGVSTKYLNNYLVWQNVIMEGSRSRIELLKLAIKALVFTRWCDISSRPAVPVLGMGH